MSKRLDETAHGHIACGTISVGDLDRAVASYQSSLTQAVVETGTLDAAHVAAWGLSAVQGARYAILQAPGQPAMRTGSQLRLIEVPATAHTPARSLGWNAFEITVDDVFGLAQRLEQSAFQVVGPPKHVDGFTSFVPMQVFGADGEVLFLNQVFHSDADTDLPLAQSAVGELFIVVLASPDRQRSANQYAQALDMDIAGTHELRYSLINRAFGFDPQTLQTITMVQKARRPFLQADQYPKSAEPRRRPIDGLPMGNAMVSVRVDCIDRARNGFAVLGSVERLPGALYRDRRVLLVQGLAGELLELIECDAS